MRGLSNSGKPDDVVRRFAGGTAFRLRKRRDPRGKIGVEAVVACAMSDVVERGEYWR